VKTVQAAQAGVSHTSSRNTTGR